LPALPNVSQVFRVEFIWTIGEDASGLTRLFFHYTGGTPSPADMLTWAADFQGDWANFIEPLCHTDTSVQKTIVTDLTTASSPVGEFTGPDVGTRAGTALPAGAALVMDWTIARRYRGGKPRSYLPFGVAGDLADRQTWAAGFLSSVAGGLAAWRTAVLGRTVSGVSIDHQVNVSYYQGFTPVRNPITGRYRNVPNIRGVPVVDNITAGGANSRVGSQRRRNLIRP
jgi:hypothetical protein